MRKNVAPALAAAALLAISALWGSTFVVIKDAVTRMDVADMLAFRFAIAAAALVAIGWRHLRADAATVARAAAIGVCFGAGQALQAHGLRHTGASVSGFLTGAYVIFTPLLAHALLGERARRRVWAGVGLATIGLAVLSILPGATSSGFGLGEAMTLAGAAFYGAQIVLTGRFATRENAMSLTVWQAVVVAGMCVLSALPGGIAAPTSRADWVAVVYLALACGAVTLFAQNWAQARIDATRAAVIMCLEPVWAAVIAVATGFDQLTWRLVTGGGFMLVAMALIVLAPTPGRAERRECRRDDLASAPAEPAWADGPLMAGATPTGDVEEIGVAA